MGGLTAGYFRELKQRARDAAGRNDPALALAVCKEIGAYEVFIGESPNLQPSGSPVKLKAKYSSMCQKCGGTILPETEVLWVKNKGCWHMECLA